MNPTALPPNTPVRNTHTRETGRVARVTHRDVFVNTGRGCKVWDAAFIEPVTTGSKA